MKIVSLMFMLVVLSACQNLIPADETLPYYKTPVGSTLVLNHDLIIPANRLSVYIQNGHVTAGGANQYYPHCKLELRQKHSSSQRVTADEFTIYRSTQHRTRFTYLQPQLIPASTQLFFNSGDRSSPVSWASFLYLRSERQPGVMLMTCTVWADLSEGRYLSIQDIRQTLGDVFSIRIIPNHAPDE